MSILKRIVAAVREGALGLAEFISEGDAIQKLERELREVEDNLRQAKQDLTSVMARKMASSREMTTLKMKIAEFEMAAGDALERGNEAEALDHAGSIAGLDSSLAEAEKIHEVYAAHVSRLKSLVDQSERQTNEVERQLTMVKTTESLHKASEAITKNYEANSSKILTARESLENIKQRQRKNTDLMEAKDIMEKDVRGKSLDEQLEAIGISDAALSAAAVLDRIKAKRP